MAISNSQKQKRHRIYKKHAIKILETVCNTTCKEIVKKLKSGNFTENHSHEEIFEYLKIKINNTKNCQSTDLLSLMEFSANIYTFLMNKNSKELQMMRYLLKHCTRDNRNFYFVNRSLEELEQTSYVCHELIYEKILEGGKYGLVGPDRSSRRTSNK